MKLIFQMACILHPECNFLHRYFRYQLPEEMLDVEVKAKTMQGIHTFRRDKTSQVIKFNPWSTRLHPYPSLTWKMKTCLELEDRLGPMFRPRPQTQLQQTQPQQTHMQPFQLSTNPRVRKFSGPTTNVTDKRRKTMISKRRYKVRVLTQPTPSTPISNASVPTVATVSTLTPVVRSTAESIPVTLHKLAIGQFAEVPHTTTRSLNDNPPPL